MVEGGGDGGGGKQQWRWHEQVNEASIADGAVDGHISGHGLPLSALWQILNPNRELRTNASTEVHNQDVAGARQLQQQALDDHLGVTAALVLPLY